VDTHRLKSPLNYRTALLCDRDRAKSLFAIPSAKQYTWYIIFGVENERWTNAGRVVESPVGIRGHRRSVQRRRREHSASGRRTSPSHSSLYLHTLHALTVSHSLHMKRS